MNSILTPEKFIKDINKYVGSKVKITTTMGVEYEGRISGFGEIQGSTKKDIDVYLVFPSNDIAGSEMEKVEIIK